MTPEERDQHNHVKIRVRGEQVQVVNAYSRKVLYRAYFEQDAEEWCVTNHKVIVERP